MATGYEASFEPAMREALAEAVLARRDTTPSGELPRTPDGPGTPRSAAAQGDDRPDHADVPVGAVILDPGGAVVSRAHNRREADADPTAHAEIVAIRAAARLTGRWRLDGHTLVVTLEPCTMCAGAVAAARIARLVYGAADPKAGAVGSLWDVLRDRRLPHRTEVVGGVLAAECGALLHDFFAQRRQAGPVSHQADANG